MWNGFSLYLFSERRSNEFILSYNPRDYHFTLLECLMAEKYIRLVQNICAVVNLTFCTRRIFLYFYFQLSNVQNQD